MDPFFFMRSGKDIEVFLPKINNKYYDLERSLERRNRHRPLMLRWTAKLSDFWSLLVYWERRVQRLPYTLAHAQIKPIAIRRHHRK